VSTSPSDLERIAKRVQEVLASQGHPPIAATTPKSRLSPQQVAQLIDHTICGPTPPTRTSSNSAAKRASANSIRCASSDVGIVARQASKVRA